MRWFVDISSLAPGGDTSRFCVEAEQWQRALQSIRSLRGDTSPFSSFSIELLDDGYRAIDPTTRLRFTVQKAPDDAEIVLPNGESNGATSKPPAAALKSEAPRSQSRRGRTGVSIPSDPVPRITSDKPAAPTPLSTPPHSAPPQSAAPQSAAPQSAPPRPASTAPASNGSPSNAPADLKPTQSRPMQAETAFEKMTQGISFPLSTQREVVVSQASTQILPPFTIQSERDQKPTPEAPLTYREMVLVVDESTSIADAEAIARGQFEVIRASLASGPKGIFITVAVFDHAFDKKPARLPLATLSFKDWRDKEPQTFFPLRDGPPVRASMAPPTAKVPIDARASALPPTTPSASPPPGENLAKTASSAPPPASTAAPVVLKATSVIPVPRIVSEPPAAPPVSVLPASVVPAAPSAPPAAPTQASSGTPAVAVPPPPPSAPESLTTVMEQPSEEDLDFGPDTIGTPPRSEEDEPKTDAPTPVFLGAASLPAPSIRVVAGAGTSSLPPRAEAATPEAIPEPTPGTDAETQPIHVAVAEAPVAEPPLPTTLTGTTQMPASQPPPPGSQPPPPMTAKRRVRGDDLIAELFEALSDLEFLSDPLEGADFVLATALEKIPCEAGLVSFFSLDKQEFVVVRASTHLPKGTLLARATEKNGVLCRAMRLNQTLIVSGSPVRELEDDPRWKATGLAVHCIACVPINFGGRYLGVLEIANPTDGIPLAAADGHALTYIGQQFAEFLSKRELVFDADRVLAPRLRDRVAK